MSLRDDLPVDTRRGTDSAKEGELSGAGRIFYDSDDNFSGERDSGTNGRKIVPFGRRQAKSA